MFGLLLYESTRRQRRTIFFLYVHMQKQMDVLDIRPTCVTDRFQVFKGRLVHGICKKLLRICEWLLTKAHPSKFMQDGHDVGTNCSKVAGK